MKMNSKAGILPINSCTSHWPEKSLRERNTGGITSENETGQLEEVSLDLQFDDTDHIIRQHFNEVIRRHHLVLAQKNRRIEELEEALAQYRKEDAENTSRTVSSVDLPQESSTSEQLTINKTSFDGTDLKAFREKVGPLMKSTPFKAADRQKYPIPSNEPLEKEKFLTADKERSGITDRQLTKGEHWTPDEQVLMNDKQINTKQQLTDLGKTLPPIQHNIIEDKKLQEQTKSAVESNNNEESNIDEKRMIDSSLDGNSYELTTGNEKMREKYDGIAGLEQLGRDFLRRLDFEEQLDKIHWQIEARRLFADQQEYKMLVTARNNLINSVREFKRKIGIDWKEDGAKNSQLTFKTLYRPCSLQDFSSDGEWL